MDFLNTVLSRRSIRKYQKNKLLSEKDLQLILKMGMYAPSAMNKQPWEILVCQDIHLLDKITQIHPYAGFAKEAGTALVICANEKIAYNGYAPIDCSLCCQNILLTSTYLGYGSCYCGIYPEPVKVQAFIDLLSLPKNIIPIALIVIGVADEKKEIPNRFMEEKVHLNSWK